MRRYALIFSILCLAIVLIVPNAYPQKKIAQTGFQFLSVGTVARATAMGEAYTTVQASSDALFYNPAGLAGVTSFLDISLNQMEWIADIKYMSGSLALNPAKGKYGVLGFSFQTVDYGKFYWTRVDDNPLGYVEIGNEFSGGPPEPSAHVIGFGYANQLTDRFAVGGQVKYVYQNLGKSFVPIFTKTDTTFKEKEYAKGIMAFDFGTIYKTGFRSLVFGMSVRNFAQEVKFEEKGFQLPLTFKIGISMDAFDFLPGNREYHSFIVSMDAVHPRSYPEFINFGGEYSFMKMLYLRVGYITNQDEYNFTTGVGFNKFGLAVDYSYMPFSVFDSVNRISFKFVF